MISMTHESTDLSCALVLVFFGLCILIHQGGFFFSLHRPRAAARIHAGEEALRLFYHCSLNMIRAFLGWFRTLRDALQAAAGQRVRWILKNKKDKCAEYLEKSK